MTEEKRVPLYERLPEIYRTKDAEPPAPYHLRSFLALVEEAFGHIDSNIEALYHDLFIETAADWVVPYIGDLLGTSHLSGDPWTLRADVADTIALRRRKGTLGAVELLAYNLTRWGAHCVELRENLVWNQHLNHQRPDEGGRPPYGLPTRAPPDRHPRRDGDVARPGDALAPANALRPVRLHSRREGPGLRPDTLQPAEPRHLPVAPGRLPRRRLASRLRRLRPHAPRPTRPHGPTRSSPCASTSTRSRAPKCPRPREQERQPVRLFNTHRFDLFNGKREGVDKLDLSRMSFDLSLVGRSARPHPARTPDRGRAGRSPRQILLGRDLQPGKPRVAAAPTLRRGWLQLHLPEAPDFAGEEWPVALLPPLAWKVRGANLCAWETGLKPPLGRRRS